MNRIWGQWREKDDGQVSGSYDFAEIIPIWKTWWFWVIVGAGCAGTLGSTLMRWI